MRKAIIWMAAGAALAAMTADVAAATRNGDLDRSFGLGRAFVMAALAAGAIVIFWLATPASAVSFIKDDIREMFSNSSSSEIVEVLSYERQHDGCVVIHSQVLYPMSRHGERQRTAVFRFPLEIGRFLAALPLRSADLDALSLARPGRPILDLQRVASCSKKGNGLVYLSDRVFPLHEGRGYGKPICLLEVLDHMVDVPSEFKIDTNLDQVNDTNRVRVDRMIGSFYDFERIIEWVGISGMSGIPKDCNPELGVEYPKREGYEGEVK